jgi:hypothetical protein
MASSSVTRSSRNDGFALAGMSWRGWARSASTTMSARFDYETHISPQTFTLSCSARVQSEFGSRGYTSANPDVGSMLKNSAIAKLRERGD